MYNQLSRRDDATSLEGIMDKEQINEESKDASGWHSELKRYETQLKAWTLRGEKIIKRYRDERKDTEQSEAKFNILWSNIRILKPAVYSRTPKPEVSRRFKDKNPIARVASTIIERALEFELSQYTDFHSAMSNVVEDRMLPGRGVAWIRYEPTIETIEAEPQISDDVEAGEGEGHEGYDEGDQSSEANGLMGEEPETFEQITNETTCIDYVYWKDFAHLPARTWEEVTWVARRVFLSLEEGVERFGEDFRQVPRNHKPAGEDDEESPDKAKLKKAEVWEIWCKSEKKVYWVAKDWEKILDERDDPLELENFFPCPKPYFATISTGSLVPVPDYAMYQDQADEIDEITSRIRHLTRSLKVMGIYAADEPAIERLLKEGNDAVLIPVKNWPAFMEKGGLGGAVQFMKLQDVVQALQHLYTAREACKQIIYETTGLSDILRGASMASETATAQQIKSQYASIRLNEMKDDCARFARELMRMKAEVMCSKYQPQTLVDISGIMNTPDGQYAEQAIQLLKNEPLRNFSIDIETDTLVQLDEQTEKQNRMEFLSAAGGFLEKAVAAGQQAPELLPLLGEMLLFGIRGFKIGRTLEGTFETALEQMGQSQAQKAQQPPQPDPAIAAKQAEMQQSMQLEQMKMQAQQQAEQARMQVDLQIEQAKIQAESQARLAQMQQEAQLEQVNQSAQLEFERWKAQLEADTDIAVAQIQAAQMVAQTTVKEANGAA